jgi:hypothetical protein
VVIWLYYHGELSVGPKVNAVRTSLQQRCLRALSTIVRATECLVPVDQSCCEKLRRIQYYSKPKTVLVENWYV